jgi:hypothetical protein
MIGEIMVKRKVLRTKWIELMRDKSYDGDKKDNMG